MNASGCHQAIESAVGLSGFRPCRFPPGHNHVEDNATPKADGEIGSE